ncbi:hypothetical protein ACHAXR_011292 [Thalassiosira sp. AJA248-18]
MDKWSKKKASETCGGLGMSKYIDSNEARRLNRLKTIKSSIGSKVAHNGWQKQQIEKRRKEQIRQRKKDAKKKQTGDGIQVDTKISKSDAVSKCGLKLKVIAADPASGKIRQKKEASQNTQRPRLLDPKKQTDTNRSKANAVQGYHVSSLGDRSNVAGINSDIKRGTQKYDSKQKKLPVDEGKENSDNSANKEPLNSKDSGLDVPKEDTRRVPKRQDITKKHFHMDIDSLRREHADAIKMLEELDKSEGNRRRSLDSDNSDNSSYYDRSASPEGIYNQSAFDDNHRDNNTLDDEFVRDCSCAQKENDAMGEDLPSSFLNMSHLSISIRDDFDGAGDDKEATLTPTKNRSFSLQEDFDCSDADEVPLTPTKNGSFSHDGDEGAEYLTPAKNRSFTSSCASIEDSDFFGDADIDSCSSDEDSYSSGTF